MVLRHRPNGEGAESLAYGMTPPAADDSVRFGLCPRPAEKPRNQRGWVHKSFVLVASVFIFTRAAPAQTVLRVDDDAPIGGDGLSWQSPFHDLQDALDKARIDPAVTEIWVAGGIYRPDRGTGNRDATFALVSNTGVFGGFSGHETSRPAASQRTSETVLTGDIRAMGDSADNSYNVVAVLPGIHDVRIDRCTIRDGNGTWGGGLDLHYTSYNCVVTACIFANNYARWGGGMYVGDVSGVIVVNCELWNNSSSSGGGVYITGYNSNTRIFNCLFVGNYVTAGGGGLTITSGPTPFVANCTFAANSALRDGDAIAVGSKEAAVIKSCVVWDQPGPAIYEQVPLTALISYSCIEGGWPTGEGNIDVDPRFVSIANGDYRLLPESPCIDAGDNRALPWKLTLDLDWNARVRNDPETFDTGHTSRRWRNAVVDMGCHEFQP